MSFNDDLEGVKKVYVNSMLSSAIGAMTHGTNKALADDNPAREDLNNHVGNIVSEVKAIAQDRDQRNIVLAFLAKVGIPLAIIFRHKKR